MSGNELTTFGFMGSEYDAHDLAYLISKRGYTTRNGEVYTTELEEFSGEDLNGDKLFVFLTQAPMELARQIQERRRLFHRFYGGEDAVGLIID